VPDHWMTNTSVIWITGLSGSGKTTIATALAGELRSSNKAVVVLDGDHLRQVFGADPDYSIAGRERQVRRLQRLAKAISDQGVIVIVAALYPNPELLSWNRQNIDKYYEIYLRASVEFLSKNRDIKGLYRKALVNEIDDVVGVQIPWVKPESPDLIIPVDDSLSIDDILYKILSN